MVPSSSLIPRSTVFRDRDLVIYYWQNAVMTIRHFQLPGFMSNALALPAAVIFLL